MNLSGETEGLLLQEDVRQSLLPYARKYIWWKSPEEALSYPERVIAQVMDVGTFEDVRTLTEQLGEDRLFCVLKHAEAGQFSPRSWAYWHCRFGVEVPEEMPLRRFE